MEPPFLAFCLFENCYLGREQEVFPQNRVEAAEKALPQLLFFERALKPWPECSAWNIAIYPRK
jgi:hypothetical protein